MRAAGRGGQAYIGLYFVGCGPCLQRGALSHLPLNLPLYFVDWAVVVHGGRGVWSRQPSMSLCAHTRHDGREVEIRHLFIYLLAVLAFGGSERSILLQLALSID